MPEVCPRSWGGRSRTLPRGGEMIQSADSADAPSRLVRRALSLRCRQLPRRLVVRKATPPRRPWMDVTVKGKDGPLVLRATELETQY